MPEDSRLTEIEKHQLATASARAESESKHATTLTDGFVKSIVALAAGVMSLGVSVAAVFQQRNHSWLLAAAWVGLLGTVAVGLLLQRLFRDLTTLSYKKQDALYKQACLSCLGSHAEAEKLLDKADSLAKEEDKEFGKYFLYETVLLALFLAAILLMTIFGIVNLAVGNAPR